MQALAADLLAQGYIVMAESPDGRGYTAVRQGETVRIPAATQPSKTSFKEAVFPKTEPVFYYRKNVNDVALIGVESAPRGTVVFGAKPCDAKSVSLLSKLFNWDYRDDLFNARADGTIIVGTACTYRDDHCFCTSVGLSPVSTEGSDLFLIPLADGSQAVRVLTPKGDAFLARFAAHFAEGDPDIARDAEAAIPIPAPRFDAAAVHAWLKGHFEDALASDVGERCLGCAQCAFVCPTCHCFDIVDEESSYLEGRRMKNWDGCQAPLFTRHASGHNPRETQARRYRQRVNHKFHIFPERFGETLCTGCGRCSRGCAVGIDIAEVVEHLPMSTGEPQ
jgi:ferredoxin